MLEREKENHCEGELVGWAIVRTAVVDQKTTAYTPLQTLLGSTHYYHFRWSRWLVW